MQTRGTNNKEKRRGFSVKVNGKYVAFINIAEFTGNKENRKRNLPEGTADNMEDVANFEALMSQAELVPYVEDKPVGDFSDIDAIMTA